ncbi:MAG TPA: hypothetical protein VK178_18820 [Opitutaceae bacterium]|nr:hypothetical protein [Opitutaceae bacterium]
MDYLPLRLAEAAAFYAGDADERRYPRWIRRLGQELAHAALPRDWCQSGDAAPKEFFGGLVAGLSLRVSSQGIRSVLPDGVENLPIERLMHDSQNTGIQGADVRAIVDEIEAGKHLDDIRNSVTNALTLAPPNRHAFFHGFLLGQDMDRAIAIGTAEMAKRSRGKKVFNYVKLYLWLCWPQVEAIGSMPALYDWCYRAFQSTENPDVLSSDDSLRKYCNRIGLSFRSPDSGCQ